MAKLYLKNEKQKDAYTTPWSKKEAILTRLWELLWVFFISWLPKKGSCFYIFMLRCFGANIPNHIFIHPSAKVYAPWLLSLGNQSCIGAKAEIYNLGPVQIGERVTLAQYSYVCNGTHDLCDKRLPLMVGNTIIGNDVFVGAKAIIMPGINIEEGCVLGAGAVLTKDTEPYGVYVGNPAKFIKKRDIKNY